MIEVLGTKISDAQFANDLIIDSLTRHINKLIELQGIFTVKNERYQNIWQTFGQFLMNFQSDCDQNVWGPTILQQIYDYTIKQDDKNLIEIMKWFEEAMADYEQL